jgi:hypothetical protein
MGFFAWIMAMKRLVGRFYDLLRGVLFASLAYLRPFNIKNPNVLGLYPQEIHLGNHKEKEFLAEDTSKGLKKLKSIKVVLNQLQELPLNDSEYFSTEEKYLLKFLIQLISEITDEEVSEMIKVLNSKDSLL